MNKLIAPIVCLGLTATSELMACPLCSGQTSKDKYYIYIVGTFILLIYFPMFYLFKTFMKYKNINNGQSK